MAVGHRPTAIRMRLPPDPVDRLEDGRAAAGGPASAPRLVRHVSAPSAESPSWLRDRNPAVTPVQLVGLIIATEASDARPDDGGR